MTEAEKSKANLKAYKRAANEIRVEFITLCYEDNVTRKCLQDLYERAIKADTEYGDVKLRQAILNAVDADGNRPI